MSNNKVLIISGPTATGKTSLAIKIAKKLNGELISADSRQIYRGMDIGTGKDHPKNIKISLVDIIYPNQTFSVADFQKLAFQKIKSIHRKNKLPIIVGGTGFYIDSLVNQNTQTFSIKPNNYLRFILNKLPTNIIKFIYKSLDKKSFQQLNNSEQNNPHRLIRKIEIKLFKNNFPNYQKENKKNFSILHLSLIAPKEYLYQQIDKRVDQRLKLGLLEEIRKLLINYSWPSPGLNTLAYKEFKNYFNHQEDLDNAISRWKYDEHAYARRQLTWFKKQSSVNFLDILAQKYPKNAIDIVTKWYN